MERRAVDRKEFTKALDFKASSFESSTFGKGKGFDISCHGLGILTDYRLQKGMVVRLVLPEYWHGTAIPVFAEVAWTRPLKKNLRAGLRFI